MTSVDQIEEERRARERERDRQARELRAQRDREQAAARAEWLSQSSVAIPTVLGRVFSRMGAGVVELVLVDKLPGDLPMRLLIGRGRAVDPTLVVGTFRALGATLIEAGSFAEPTSRFWQSGVIDPFSGGGTFTPPADLPPVDSPLYTSAPDETAPRTDEERAGDLDRARRAVDALAPTKAKARDLAAALRAALATGPESIDAFALALEERAGTTAPDAASSPST